jgi:hypothetical protein
VSRGYGYEVERREALVHAFADAVDVPQFETEKNSGRLSLVMTVSPSGFCRSEPTLPRNTFGAMPIEQVRHSPT